MFNKRFKTNQLVLLGVGMGGLIVSIDFTIVNTVLGNIQSGLSASIHELQWVMAGFGLVFCTLLVTMGRLGDIIGHRTLFYIGLIGFGLASLGAGLSYTAQELIIFRVLQGIFAAIEFPCGIGIISNTFTGNARNQALGICGSLIGIGIASGPVIGGFIASIANWRWVFFINIPIVLISLAICLPNVQQAKLPDGIKMDWGGFVTLTICIGSLVFAINESLTLGLDSPVILGLFATSLIFLILTIIIEQKHPNPLLPIHYILHSNFMLGSIAAIVGVGLTWPLMFILPLYLHDVLHLPNDLVGLQLLPMTAMTAIVPAIAAKLLSKKGAFFVLAIMFTMLFLSYFGQLQLDQHHNLWLLLATFITFGIAWGIGNGISNPLAIAQPDGPLNAGVISGALVTLLNISGVISLSLGITLFRYSIAHRSHGTEAIKDVAGYHNTVWFLSIIAIVAFFVMIAIILINRKRNHSSSPKQQ